MILCFQLCGNSWGSPFLSQHDNAPVHKASSIQKWFVKIGVEELHSIYPSNTFWDELERRLRARPNRPTSVPDLTNDLVTAAGTCFHSMFQQLVESLPRWVEAVYSRKGGTKFILMPVILEWDYWWAGVYILVYNSLQFSQGQLDELKQENGKITAIGKSFLWMWIHDNNDG